MRACGFVFSFPIPILKCPKGRFRHAACVGFDVDAFEMGVQGAVRDPQSIGDFFSGLSLGCQAENVFFFGGKLVFLHRQRIKRQTGNMIKTERNIKRI